MCTLHRMGAAQSSIFGRLGIFSTRSAGSSRKLRLNSNHALKVNARPYWTYNRPIMRCMSTLRDVLFHKALTNSNNDHSHVLLFIIDSPIRLFVYNFRHIKPLFVLRITYRRQFFAKSSKINLFIISTARQLKEYGHCSCYTRWANL